VHLMICNLQIYGRHLVFETRIHSSFQQRDFLESYGLLPGH